MKRLLTIVAVLGITWTSFAQNRDTEMQLKLDEAKARLEDFNTEYSLDTLDQEKLPHVVSGGVFAGVNTSNFIFTRAHTTMSS